MAVIADGITDPAVSYNNERLEKAVEYADKVINSGVYSLASDFRNLWGLANESKGPEQIFTIRHDGDGIDKQGATTRRIAQATIRITKTNRRTFSRRTLTTGGPTHLINLIRTRGFDGNSSHNIASVTLQNIQDEWEYEFRYEQHRWLNLTRWKNLITTVRTLVLISLTINFWT